MRWELEGCLSLSWCITWEGESVLLRSITKELHDKGAALASRLQLQAKGAGIVLYLDIDPRVRKPGEALFLLRT